MPRGTGALFILDEVMTGFRVALGGAQAAWGLDPDLTCLGKVIGGGLPVGAYAGKREIMQQVAPAGPDVPGGHALGQPAGDDARAWRRCRVLSEPGVFEAIALATQELVSGIKDGRGASAAFRSRSARRAPCSASTSSRKPARPSPTGRARSSTRTPTATAVSSMRCSSAGVYFAPSQFEAAFMSTAHGPEEIEETAVRGA